MRKVIGGLASLGTVETAYLSYVKLFKAGGISNLCGSAAESSSCTSVLDGPYATVHLGDASVPLTVIGSLAYGTVVLLAFLPILIAPTSSEDENKNRLAILCATTSMATFSVFLLILLFNVLHQSCPYCIASASISIVMGLLAWFSGFLPPSSANLGLGSTFGFGSVGTATVAALALFFSVDASSASSSPVGSSGGSGGTPEASSLVVASSETNIPPPPVTASSTPQSLKIAEELNLLDAKMYGAYWCSHCFDQKQRLGRDAMRTIPYIECAKDGKNSQRDMCEKQKIAGYPTWEIGGKRYPGEWDLEELENIIKDVNAGK